MSFDVEALFPNVPVEKALSTMKYHLSRTDVSKEMKEIIMKASTHCMEQNQFQFREKFYKQKFGVAIGNSLSPKMASFFMTHFENLVKRASWFPRLWIRYVDDIFAIVKRNKLELIIQKLNSQFESINFTYEEESNECIAFLDLLITRKEEGVKFSIYRKPTSTQQFIPKDSNHSKQHKMAAFHSMFHRLLRTPMDIEDFEREKNYIIETARLNGYNVEDMIKNYQKHEKKNDVKNSTALVPVDDRAYKYISMPFFPQITQKLENELKKFDIKISYNNRGKLSDVLGSSKDIERDELEKSGIYTIECSLCDVKYIGQTKRNLRTRFKEHQDDCRKPASEEKPMPQHAIESGHPFKNIQLLKEVKSPFYLNAYESLFLHKNSNMSLVNIQLLGNSPSTLFQFI